MRNSILLESIGGRLSPHILDLNEDGLSGDISTAHLYTFFEEGFDGKLES